MIDLNKLCEVSLANATQRMNNGAFDTTDTREVLKHCATEVVEAMDAFDEYRFAVSFRKFIGEPPTKELKEHNVLRTSEKVCKELFASELADIICCVLIIAGKEGIDIEDAITKCIEKNRLRAEGKGDKK